MILQWFKKYRTNRLELEISCLEAEINYLSNSILINGTNIEWKIFHLRSKLAKAQTKLKQLKND